MIKIFRNSAFTVFLFAASLGITQQTIVLKPGPTEGKDARVWSLSPDNNYWNYPYIKANAWTWGGNFGIERTFIEFDLDSLPPDSEILSAKLSFFYHFLGGTPEQTHSGDNYCLIQRVISPWTENGVTWNNQPATSGDNQVILEPTTDPQQDYTDIDVTNLVVDMLNDPENSYGFLFRILDEEEYRRSAYASSDHPDPEKWPMLGITYECDLPVADFSFVQEDGYFQFTDLSLNATSWNWDFGDGYYSSLQNPVHQYLSSGLYSVCLTVENSCGTDTKCDTVRPIISHSPNKMTENVNIYPNPTNGLTKISIGKRHTELVNINISDFRGKTILAGRRQLNGKDYFTIDFSDFVQGIYIIRLESDNINETQKIFIK